MSALFTASALSYAAVLLPHSLASGGVTIDFDRSFLVHSLLFITLIVVLKPLLFDPLLRVFEQRERRTEGARADARDMQARAEALIARYETEVAKVRAAAAEEHDKLRAETLKLETQILDEARQSASKLVEEGRARIGAEASVLRRELDQKTQEVSRQIASTIIGRDIA